MPVVLKDYQEDAVNRMHNGCILCGSVGSGKSLTSLSYYLRYHHHRELYIITTARKRDTFEWVMECDKAGCFARVVDSWNNIEKYTGCKDAFFIFDEQRVVGYGAWSKAFIKIAKQNKWILLSATPGDTWLDYLPVFLANGYYRNKTQFIAEHVVYSRFSKYPRVDHYINVGRLEHLRNTTLVVMNYHRTVTKERINIVCEYDVARYNHILKDRWNDEEDRPCRDINETCLLLRKVVNSGKERSDRLVKIYREHRRAIIFYNFNYELEELQKICDANNIRYAEWNGRHHQEIPGDVGWLYLVQYTAGAEGWNCITCNAIIFWSLNYSYKIMTQAAGRIDRMNSPFTTLYYYYFYTDSSIDRAILRCQKMKQNFNEKIFLTVKEREPCLGDTTVEAEQYIIPGF